MTDELASIRRMRDQAKGELSEKFYEDSTGMCREGVINLIGGTDDFALRVLACQYDALIEDGRIEGTCLFCCSVIDLYDDVVAGQ